VVPGDREAAQGAQMQVMTEQTFIAPGYRVELSAEVVQAMAEQGRAALPLETGGFLVGFYSDDGATARVTQILAATSDSIAGRRDLVMGTEGIAEKLGELWRATPRRYYLGTWHTHPGGSSTPSETDDATMIEEARSKTAECPEAILVIVGGDLAAPEISVSVYPRRRRVPVRLRASA
jgi:integrative and conjugative element protein (TIGR02256 family)